MTMEKNRKRNFGLVLARSIAISMVIVSHFANKTLDIFGFWGVELFLHLADFSLIEISLWRSYSESTTWNHLRVFNFWSRRWWRTLAKLLPVSINRISVQSF